MDELARLDVPCLGGRCDFMLSVILAAFLLILNLTRGVSNKVQSQTTVDRRVNPVFWSIIEICFRHEQRSPRKG